MGLDSQYEVYKTILINARIYNHNSIADEFNEIYQVGLTKLWHNKIHFWLSDFNKFCQPIDPDAIYLSNVCCCYTQMRPILNIMNKIDWIFIAELKWMGMLKVWRTMGMVWCDTMWWPTVNNNFSNGVVKVFA